MRIVLDANVLVSALISSRGSPTRLLLYWEEGKLDLVVSPPILQELDRVVHYPKLQARYALSAALVERFLAFCEKQAIVVMPKEEVAIVDRDPSDNRYLECALAGDARYVVSGDRHLLDLKAYRGIQILTPTEFVALFELGEIK